MGVVFKRRIDAIKFDREAVNPSPIWLYFSQELADILGEIIEDENLLRHCYCGSRARSFDETFLPSVITDVSPGMLSVISEYDDSAQWLAEKLKQISPQSPWIILGPPGCGKSTYLHYFFSIKTKELGIKDKIEPIFVDLRGENDAEQVEKTIWDSVIEVCCRYHSELRELKPEIVKEVFSKDLAPYRGLLESAWWQSPEVVTQRLYRIVSEQFQPNKRLWACRLHEYHCIKSQYPRIIIVLDNIDNKTTEFQTNAFRAAALAVRTLGVPAIISMRTYTYPAAFHHMGMSQWIPRHLSLRAPDRISLLKLRFKYLIEVGVSHRYPEIEGKGWTLKIEEWNKEIKSTEDVRELLKALQDAFIASPIVNTLLQLSGENIRLMLEISQKSLQSYWIISRNPVDADGTLRFRFYSSDLIKALMLGNNRYMNLKDPTTYIVNIFDNPEVLRFKYTKSLVLLGFRLLQMLEFFSHQGTTVDGLTNCLEIFGYERSLVKKRAFDYLQRGLINTIFSIEPLDSIDQLADDEVIRISEMGKFILDELSTDFTYVENVKWATYVPEEVYQKMLTLHQHETPLDRLKATQEFVSFLITEDLKDIVAVRESSSDAEVAISHFLRENISGSIFGRKIQGKLLEAAVGILKKDGFSNFLSYIPGDTLKALGLSQKEELTQLMKETRG